MISERFSVTQVIKLVSKKQMKRPSKVFYSNIFEQHGEHYANKHWFIVCIVDCCMIATNETGFRNFYIIAREDIVNHLRIKECW